MKNPHAQALGSLGGIASANSLTKEQRVSRAKKAVTAREAKRALSTTPAQIEENTTTQGIK